MKSTAQETSQVKPETYIPVYAAIVAAAASIFGILYNQYSALQLEEKKWAQSVKVETNKIEREAVTEFTKAFSASFYLMKEMIWRAEMTYDVLTAQDFQAYAKASDLLKPRLVSAEALLAATNQDRHAKLEATIAEYYRVDEQLVVAGRNIAARRAEMRTLLDDEVKRFPAFRDLFLKSLNAAAATESISPLPNKP